MSLERGAVRKIQISSRAGEAMTEISGGQFVVGYGIKDLEGNEDRYFAATGQENRGAWKADKPRQVTIITQEAIRRANMVNGMPFTFAHTRRNILIDGISGEELNSLVDGKIKLGEVEIQITELCSPCDRPSKLAGIKGFKESFTSAEGKSIAGVRGNISKGGILLPGEHVFI